MKRFLLVLALTLPGPSFAGYVNGQKLLGWIDGYEAVKQGAVSAPAQVEFNVAMGYVMGVVDVNNGIFFCLPKTVSVGQAVAITAKWLKDNPERWNAQADELVVEALKPAFPCPKKP